MICNDCDVRYARQLNTNHDELVDDNWGFTPKCHLEDSERFQSCIPLTVQCTACHQVSLLYHITSYYIISNAI